jgi:dephospho-CoA kinase
VLLVGLTGGIASGKSLVARVFKDLGAHVIDADRIVHDLLQPGQNVWQEVVDHFGKGILLPDKCIDRRKLGDVVFTDAEKRDWLNRCIHPKVFAAFSAHVKHLRDRQPAAIVVFDAVLLIETGYNLNMDKTVVVYAKQEQQIERLSSRNGFGRSHALARIQSQMSLEQKLGHADYIIYNTGTREQTEKLAKDVFLKLKNDAEKIGAASPADLERFRRP